MLKRSSWYRTIPGADSMYRFGKGCWVDFLQKRAGSPKGERNLTEREHQVMKYLIERKTEPVSRDEMLQQIWGFSPGVETRTLDNFIHRLRTYFEKDPSSPRHILSVRGWGYKFQP